MSALIEFDEVCKYYQMGDTTVKAADHITMKIEKGEFVATIILQMKIAMTIPMLHFHPVMRQRLHLLTPTQKAFQMKTVREYLNMP